MAGLLLIHPMEHLQACGGRRWWTRSGGCVRVLAEVGGDAVGGVGARRRARDATGVPTFGVLGTELMLASIPVGAGAPLLNWRVEAVKSVSASTSAQRRGLVTHGWLLL